MNTETLKALEEAIGPYLEAGCTITSQTESSIKLVGEHRRFSYLGFIVGLLLFWPAAFIYLIAFNNRKSGTVCLSINSRGVIEASEHTLDAAARERGRALIPTPIEALILAAIVGLFLLWLSARF